MTISDIVRNYKPISSPIGRIRQLVKASVGALRDPLRADLVAECGDLSSQAALQQIQAKMVKSESGRLILREMPRVTNETWPVQKMLEMNPNTFGYQYALWMQKHSFSSNERPVVKYVQDVELAYIMQRYREVHDTLHVLLGKRALMYRCQKSLLLSGTK